MRNFGAGNERAVFDGSESCTYWVAAEKRRHDRRTPNRAVGRRLWLWRTGYYLLRGALHDAMFVLVFFSVPPFTRQAAGL